MWLALLNKFRPVDRHILVRSASCMNGSQPSGRTIDGPELEDSWWSWSDILSSLSHRLGSYIGEFQTATNAFVVRMRLPCHG